MIDVFLNDYAVRVCDILYKCYEEAVRSRGSFNLVLSGGSTPVSVFNHLRSNYSEKISWSKVHFFWTDERCVSPSSDDSNYKSAFEHLLKYFVPGSVNRIHGELSPERAAGDYEQLLSDFFGCRKGGGACFDFVLLGMGEDGHTASLFPGVENICAPEGLVSYTPIEVAGTYRVSLSESIIDNAKAVVLLVSSERKKVVLSQTELSLPIHRIRITHPVFTLSNNRSS